MKATKRNPFRKPSKRKKCSRNYLNKLLRKCEFDSAVNPARWLTATFTGVYTGRIILTLLLFFGVPSFAKVYYVNSASILNSIPQVNSLPLIAGDSVLFAVDQTFYGSLITKPSVYYGSYGSGTKPVITGFKQVTSWTALGNGIYESAVISTLPTCNMVLVSGKVHPMGRYPNTTYLPIVSHSGNTSVTTNINLAAFTNGQIVIRKKQWVIDRNKITSVKSKTVNYKPIEGSATQYNPANGWGFFIQDHPLTLDQVGEWYYNPSTKRLRVYMGNTILPVQVATIEDVVILKGATIEGLQITGANRDAISIQSNGATIHGNQIQYAGRNAINQTAGYSNYSIKENNISFANNSSIYFYSVGSNHVILNNYISDNGMIAGAGNSGDIGQGAIYDHGSNLTIVGNLLVRLGYSGIRAGSTANVKVKNNVIDTYCLIKNDGAGIYFWNGATNAPTPVNISVVGNILLNAIGNYQGTDATRSEAYGIYMDLGASNVTVEGNTIANCYYGIVSLNAHHISFVSNTVYNCKSAAVYWKNKPVPVTGLNIKRNIYFAKGGSTVRWWDVSGTSTIAQFGASDSNYYCSKVSYHIETAQPAWSPYSVIPLSEFRSKFGYDLKSIEVPYKADRFEYNATPTDRVVVLSRSYKDVYGKVYSGSVTLKPFSSIVLLEY